MAEEGLQKTANGLISIAKPIQFDEDNLWKTLDKLCVEAYNETGDMKSLVKELVPTYTIDEREEERAVTETATEENKEISTDGNVLSEKARAAEFLRLETQADNVMDGAE